MVRVPFVLLPARTGRPGLSSAVRITAPVTVPITVAGAVVGVTTAWACAAATPLGRVRRVRSAGVGAVRSPAVFIRPEEWDLAHATAGSPSALSTSSARRAANRAAGPPSTTS